MPTNMRLNLVLIIKRNNLFLSIISTNNFKKKYMDFNLVLMKNYFTCKCIILITPLGFIFLFLFFCD